MSNKQEATGGSLRDGGGRLAAKLADTEEQRQYAETERDRLWDACLAVGHGPDAASRSFGAPWLNPICEGPNSDENPCPICTVMAQMRPVAYENPPRLRPPMSLPEQHEAFANALSAAQQQREHGMAPSESGFWGALEEYLVDAIEDVGLRLLLHDVVGLPL